MQFAYPNAVRYRRPCRVITVNRTINVPPDISLELIATANMHLTHNRIKAGNVISATLQVQEQVIQRNGFIWGALIPLFKEKHAPYYAYGIARCHLDPNCPEESDDPKVKVGKTLAFHRAMGAVGLMQKHHTFIKDDEAMFSHVVLGHYSCLQIHLQGPTNNKQPMFLAHMGVCYFDDFCKLFDQQKFARNWNTTATGCFLTGAMHRFFEKNK